jgi:hypothetical protein
MSYIEKYDDEWEAFEGVVKWLGEGQANVVFGVLRQAIDEGAPPGTIRLGFALQGVEGYPVKAFLDRYYPYQ